jgi:hypothetical protein
MRSVFYVDLTRLHPVTTVRPCAMRFRKNFVWTHLPGFGKRFVHGFGDFLSRRPRVEEGARQ